MPRQTREARPCTPRQGLGCPGPRHRRTVPRERQPAQTAGGPAARRPWMGRPARIRFVLRGEARVSRATGQAGLLAGQCNSLTQRSRRKLAARPQGPPRLASRASGALTVGGSRQGGYHQDQSPHGDRGRPGLVCGGQRRGRGRAAAGAPLRLFFVSGRHPGHQPAAGRKRPRAPFKPRCGPRRLPEAASRFHGRSPREHQSASPPVDAPRDFRFGRGGGVRVRRSSLVVSHRRPRPGLAGEPSRRSQTRWYLQKAVCGAGTRKASVLGLRAFRQRALRQ